MLSAANRSNSFAIIVFCHATERHSVMLQHRTEEINVDLDADNAIMVDISDALSERDKVCLFSRNHI